MAISFDNSAQASSSGSVNSLTLSSYVLGGNFLVVFFGENAGTPSQTGVTFNGVSMTELTTTQVQKVFILQNATPATANITATRSTTSTATIRLVVVSYNLTSLSGQPDNQGTHTNNGTSDSFSLTPVANNCWVIVTATNDNSNTITAGTGLTLRKANTGDPSFAILDSNGAVTGGSSYSMSINSSGSANNFETFFSVAPPSAVSSHFLSSLGAGS